MKNLKVVLWVLFSFVASLICMPSVNACTGFRMKAKDGTVVSARTLEFAQELNSNIIVLPRGMAFDGMKPSNMPGLKWTSKYAAVGTNALGQPMLMDGINEKGIAVGIFYFPGYAEYSKQTPKNENRSVAPHAFPMWVLTNFATLDEIKAALSDIVIVPTPLTASLTKEPYHYLINDSMGNAIVVEPTAGTLKVFDNPLGVITNAPRFDWHMTNLRNYLNLDPLNSKPLKIGDLSLQQLGNGSGLLGLPGDFTPPSRFIRAAFFSQFSSPVQDAGALVLESFHVLNNFDIPRGTVVSISDGKISIEETQWMSVKDLTNKRFYIRTYDNTQIRMVDLNKFDLDAKEIKTIKLTGKTSIEDLSPPAK